MKKLRFKKGMIMMILSLALVMAALTAGLVTAFADSETVIYTGKPQATYYGSCEIKLKGAEVEMKSPEGNSAASNSTNVQQYDVVLKSDTPMDATLTLEVTGSARTTSNVFGSDSGGEYQLENGQVSIPVQTTISNKSGTVQKNYTRNWNLNIWVDGLIQHQVRLPQDEKYTVVPSDGTAEVDKLHDYSFNVNIADGYRKNGTKFAVKANGTVLTPDAGGVYTIPKVTEDQEITVEGVIPEDQEVTYTVSLPSGTGYEVTPMQGYASPVKEGEDYKFKLEILENYKKGTSFAVKDNGTVINGQDDVYTLANVEDDHVITVTGVEAIMYTVQLPSGTGYVAAVVSGSTSPTQQGTSYSFTVRPTQGYKKGPDFAVKANGETLTASGDTYKFTNIHENKVITVEGIVKDDSDPENVVPINFQSTSGTVDSVTITDGSGGLIEGATFELVTGSTGVYTINVDLPHSFGNKGTVKAVFSRTPDSNGYPYMTPKDNSWAGTSSSQTYGARTDTYSATLSAGKATTTAYIYEGNNRTTGSKKGTVTIKYNVPNKLPELTDAYSSGSQDSTITAGEEFALDLTDVFTDQDNDELNWKVSVDGGTATATGKNYTFSTDQEGEYKIVFTVNDGFGDGSDKYTVNLTVNRKAGTWYITNASGTGYSTEAAVGSESPVSTGESYTVKLNVTKGYDRGPDFAVKANGVKLQEDSEGSNTFTISNITEDQTITVEGLVPVLPCIIAPAGSTITLGYGPGNSQYFQYFWVDPVKVETLDDGRVKASYEPIKNNYLYYRVENPDGVMYWNYFATKMENGDEFVVTRDKLNMDTAGFNSETVYANFEQNNLDLGDMYLNVNAQGYLPMDPGGTFQINMKRNWYAINSFTNDKTALPVTHYEVVDINGDPSDLVSVVPDKYNSAQANVKAGSGTGMAIIKVRYDAMYYEQAYGSGYGAGGSDPKRFTATWPERTGIIVVTVGQDGTGIKTNMTINEGRNTTYKTAGDMIDAENDPLFYIGDKGAEYSFTPESGTEVSVARGTVGARTLSFSGFTTEGIETDSEGKVTITGLTSGRHIIKVEKDGLANYQVVTARGVTVAFADENGTAVDIDEKIFAPGDKVTIQYKGLTSPAEKLTRAYNFNFALGYYGADGTEQLSKALTGVGQYNFSSDTAQQKITITIPEGWNRSTYELTKGTIRCGGYVGDQLDQIGDHRLVYYGMEMTGLNGNACPAALGHLPEFTLKVQQPPVRKEGIEAEVDMEIEQGKDYEVDLSTVFEDPNGDDMTYIVSVNDGDPVAADEKYSYTPEGSDDVKLVFKANDGNAESKDTYTVNITIAAHKHDMQHHDAEAATCEKEGTLEHWSCSICNKNFGDEDGTNELDTIVEPKTKHDMQHHDAEAATCEKEGTLEHWSCSKCNRNFGDEDGTNELDNIVEPKTDHHLWGDEWLPAEGSTCIKQGQEYRVCKNNENHREYRYIDLADHALIHVDAKAATCGEKGNTEHWFCEVCKGFFSDGDAHTVITEEDTKIAKTDAHKWDKGKITQKATATKDGVKTFTCAVCEATRTEPIVQAPAMVVKSTYGDETKKAIRVVIKKVAGATSYVIQYREAGSSKWISKTTKNTSYTISKLKVRGAYEVRVAAVRQSSGKTVQGKYSSVAYRYIKHAAPVKVKAEKNSAKLTWKADPKATGYKIYYATNKSMKGQKIITVKGGSKKTCTIKKLAKGKTYYFAVRPYKAKNGHNHIGISAIKTVKIK